LSLSISRSKARHLDRPGLRDLSAPAGPWRAASAPRKPRGSLLAAILAALCVALPAAAFVWRADVVRHVPETARLYAAAGLPVNLRGLSLDDVRSVEEIEQGEPVLVVSGTITNISNEPMSAQSKKPASCGTVVRLNNEKIT
jgi:hypothetical protein